MLRGSLETVRGHMVSKWNNVKIKHLSSKYIIYAEWFHLQTLHTPTFCERITSVDHFHKVKNVFNSILRHFQRYFGHIRTVPICSRCSAATLKYHITGTWYDTPSRHIVQSSPVKLSTIKHGSTKYHFHSLC